MATLSLLPRPTHVDNVIKAGKAPLCLQKGFYEMAKILHAPPVQKLRAGKETEVLQHSRALPGCAEAGS